MVNDLIIRTEFGDFDLSEGEKIVHSFSIFNLEDITGRSSDYTNEFNLPLTNNNIQIVEFANIIPTVNTFPYKKVKCEIILDGISFRKGFVRLIEISETIKCRFYTGNASFYDGMKVIQLGD